MRHIRPLYVAALVLMFLLAACGSGEVSTPEAESNPVISPLPAERAEFEIAGPNGVPPCGLGEVDWGYRVFRLEEYPACSAYLPDVTVYCLDSTASWSSENITDLSVDAEANLVAFNVQQSGLCGLFPMDQ